jgi:hypothetical protein
MSAVVHTNRIQFRISAVPPEEALLTAGEPLSHYSETAEVPQGSDLPDLPPVALKRAPGVSSMLSTNPGHTRLSRECPCVFIPDRPRPRSATGCRDTGAIRIMGRQTA